MKKLILILVVLFVPYSNANEITFEVTGKADIDGYTFNDNSSYKLYKSNGHWKSSSGDFGLHTCVGTVTNSKDGKSGFNVYCLSKNKLNACVILNMDTYPKRVLYNLLNQIIEEFQEKFKTEWEKSDKDFEFKLDSLKQHIVNYQKPEQVDKISNIKYQLDDTKEIIIKSIDKILERGEKIEDLMQRSNDLSKSSIKFYKTTKKMNRCCIIS